VRADLRDQVAQLIADLRLGSNAALMQAQILEHVRELSNRQFLVLGQNFGHTGAELWHQAEDIRMRE
jgi:hypothetical protein